LEVKNVLSRRRKLSVDNEWIAQTVCERVPGHRTSYREGAPAVRGPVVAWNREHRLDDVWRTIVDYKRRRSRPACRSRTGTVELSDAGNETSWCRAWTWPAAARWANEVRCAKYQSVDPRPYFSDPMTTRAASLSTRYVVLILQRGINRNCVRLTYVVPRYRIILNAKLTLSS